MTRNFFARKFFKIVGALIVVFFFFIGLLASIGFILERKNADIILPYKQVKDIQEKFDNKTLSYFYQTIYGEEDGRWSFFLTKWEKREIGIRLCGTPSKEDIAFVKRSLIELNNQLKFNQVILIDSDDESDVDLLFTTFDEYRKMNTQITEADILVGGCFTYEKSFKTGGFKKCRIFIDNKLVNPVRRKHTILEEITQSLGPTQDNFTYPNSIFYEGWSEDTVLAPIDKSVLDLLYNYGLKSGLHKKVFKETFLIRN